MFASLALSLACWSAAQVAPPVEAIDETLTVEGKRVSATASPRVVTYRDGVKATYDVTTVVADKLTLYLDEDARHGVAEGNVILTDPVGTARADRLVFSWREAKTGRAENLSVESGGAILTAKTATVEPERWELTDVTATSCGREKPIYSVRSPRVIVIPGKRGVAKNFSINVLGKRLFTLPQANFSLDKRVVGVRFPGISFKRGTGLGVTWNSGIMLDDHTSLTGGFSSYPQKLPGYGFEVARSRVAPTAATGPIAPRSELSERFSYGYFENIAVRTPAHEQTYMRQERDTVSVGSYWNLGVESRRGADHISKPFEVAYERSLPVGPAKSIHQVRVHNIREYRGAEQTRLMTQHVFGLPPLPLGRGLDAQLRLNANGYLNQKSLHGWARAHLGVTYQPIKQLRLGAAYMLGGEAGDAAYLADSLYSTKAWHLRGDADLGSTRLSVLGKYDIGSKRWYDHEYSVAQVIGCFEAFVLWRQFPSDYRFGLRLRADLFFEALQSRSFNRKTRQNLGKGP